MPNELPMAPPGTTQNYEDAPTAANDGGGGGVDVGIIPPCDSSSGAGSSYFSFGSGTARSDAAVVICLRRRAGPGSDPPDPDRHLRRLLAERHGGGGGGSVAGAGRQRGASANVGGGSGGGGVNNDGTGTTNTNVHIIHGSNHNANNANNNNNAEGAPPAPAADRHKYKTELCSNFLKRGKCRFGDSCKFAHGFSDLRHLTVRTLLANGAADAASRCVRPCLVHVATGHCPFGVRCTGLHDPRVDDLTDRVLRAASVMRSNGADPLAMAAVGGGGGGGGVGVTGVAGVGSEVRAATGLSGRDYRARAPAQAAAANNGGGGYGGITAHGNGGAGGGGGSSSLVGRVLQLGSAAGIDVDRADDPDRHWLDHYEHPVPGIATDLIVAHLHHHFVNGTLR